MKKYLFLLIGLFFFIPGVKAISSAPIGIQTTTSTSSYEPGIKKLPIKIYNDAYPNWDVSQFLEIYSYEEYPYIIVEFCSYYDTSYYVSSSYSTANFYNYGGTIQYSQNIGKCSITGVNGTFTKRRAVIQISSWGDPHGGAEALSTRGTIQFRNQGEYSQYIEIQNIYLTDSNQFSPNLDSTNEKIDETNSKLDEAQETRKGILDTVRSIVSGITNLPSYIWNAIKGGFEAISNGLTSLGNLITGALTSLGNFLIDGIKGLFVPTDEQLYEIINDASELSENFGFVGESVSFFINIFTALLGMVNANGCIQLPEFTIGSTTLFDSFTFWNEQNVCLADNVVLSSNIDTIRSFTSIVLVCLFLNFAARKFFTILSKNEDREDFQNEALDAYSNTRWI